MTTLNNTSLGGPDPHLLKSGMVLNGRYVIDRYLDQGGFGITYKGHDRTLDIDVAIKEYYPLGLVTRDTGSAYIYTVGGSDSEAEFTAGRQQFIREARTLARFDGDPGIVGVKDCFEENNTVYIIMEYLRGSNLKDFLEFNGRLTMAQALRLLTPVMQSLEKVHAAGLIHRDISPSNLFLTENGNVKLIDFGTARQFNENGDKSFSIYLKPGYSPEEQFLRHSEQGPWTDVYALSASIYKLITGRTPDNSLNRLSQDTLVPPAQLGADITPAQEAVLLKGMAVRRGDRYQSIRELREAFGEAQSPDPVSKYSLTDDDERTVAGPRKGSAAAGGASAAAGQPYAGAPAGSSQGAAGSSAGQQRGGSPAGAAPAGVGKYADLTAGGAQSAPADAAYGNAGRAPGGAGRIPGPGRVPGPGRIPGPQHGGIPAGGDERTRRDPSANQKRGKFPVIPAALIGLVVLVGAFLFFGRSGSAPVSGGLLSDPSLENVSFYSYSDYESASIYEETVTEEMINALDKRSKLTHISLTKCTLDDSAVKRLAAMDTVEYLSFSSCSGFTTLDPLADLSTMTELELRGEGSDNLLPVTRETFFTKDLSQVTELTLQYVRFENDFSLLTAFPNLTELDIFFSAVDEAGGKFYMADSLETLLITNSSMGAADFSAMSGSPSMEMISIQESGLTNANFVHDMPALGSLHLESNEISDIGGIRNVPELTVLEIPNNRVSDLSSVSGCPKLSTLDASGNQITDLSPLANCTQLRDLDLGQNSIRDITPVASLANLWYLYVNDNEISDLPDLSALEGLYKLRLDNNRISSLEGAAGCAKLESLSFKGNSVSSISCLSNLLYLKDLRGSGNSIASLDGLENATQLEVLFMADNGLTDISLLMQIPDHLKALAVDGNQLTSLAPVSSLTSLQALSADRNMINDLGPVSGLTGLLFLSAADNNIVSVSPLSGFASLGYLDLSGNNITSISALSDTGASEMALLLHNNQISDISALNGLKNYVLLSIYGNDIADMSRFPAMTNVGYGSKLYVSYNEGTNIMDLVESSFRSVKMIDVPQNKRVPIENDFRTKYKTPEYMTSEEADAEIEETRVSYRQKAGID